MFRKWFMSIVESAVERAVHAQPQTIQRVIEAVLPQIVADRVGPDAIVELIDIDSVIDGVRDRIDETGIATAVAQRLDIDDIVERLKDEVDVDETSVAETVADNVDTDEVIRQAAQTVADNCDTDDLGRQVAECIDWDDITLDYECLAKSLLAALAKPAVKKD